MKTIFQQKKYKILSVVFSLLVLYFLFSQIGFKDIKTVFSEIRWNFMLEALFVYIFLNLVRSFRFYFLLDKKINLFSIFNITSAHAFMLNILPARSGELFYIYQIRKNGSVGTDYNVSSLLVSRIFDTVVVCILIVLSLFFAPLLLSLHKVVLLTFLALFVSLILFFTFVFSEKTLIRFINFIFLSLKLNKWSLGDKALVKSREILTVVGKIKQSSIFVLTFIFTIIIWILISVMYWQMARGFGLSLGFWQIVFMTGLPTLVSIVPFYTLGNFGIFEGSSVLALVILGVEKGLAISFSLAVHIARIVISFIPGSISYLFLFRKNILCKDNKINGRVLFITQKIDKDDDVLGVYHRWVECLGEKIDKLNVICLYKGRNDLPDSIGAYSLGKEKKISKLKYVFNFYRYVWKLRKEYDSVFVHMNPIYIILGGLFWKLSGKKIFLWYNHPMGNLSTKAGIAFADTVFCTSPQSFSAKYKKTHLMPVGIDTETFKRNSYIQKKENRILCLGRISPIKKIEYLIEAAKILDKKGLDFELLIVGSPVSDADKLYYENLIKLSKDLISKRKIIFEQSVPNYKTPEFYNSASLYVNLTPSGSLDKAIFEAMACQVPAIVANSAFENIFSDGLNKELIFKANDKDNLSDKIIYFIKKDYVSKEKIGKKMREIVVQKHSLYELINLLASFLNL